MREFTVEGVAVRIAGDGDRDGEGDGDDSGFVSRTTGVEVTLGHLCPTCGGSDHGRPIVTGRPAISVSRSRCGALMATAVSSVGTVGIDIESVSRVGTADEAAAWVSKEALVKATGHGIRVDFREIDLVPNGDIMTVRSWPAELALIEPPIIRTFVVDDDIVGAVAIL